MSVTDLPPGLGPDPTVDTDEIPTVRLGEAAAQAAGAGPEPADVPETHEDDDAAERPRIDPVLAAVAGGLGGAAAGFMFAGAFEGILPRLVALVTALATGGLVAVSYRTRNPSALQLLVLPLALLGGAVLTVPAGVGFDQLPHLVKRERMERLVELVQRIAAERARRFVGRTMDVLVEGPSRTDASKLRGRTTHNKTVNFAGLAQPGEIVGVEIASATSTTLAGEESLLARVG